MLRGYHIFLKGTGNETEKGNSVFGDDYSMYAGFDAGVGAGGGY